MLRATLASIRAHIPRLIAVSLAIVLAVAFMSATLLLSSSTKATLRGSIGQEYANAGLVVAPERNSTVADNFSTALQAQVAKVAGVASVYVSQTAALPIDVGGGQYAEFQVLAPEAFRTTTLTIGSLPSQPDEVAVNESTAERFGLVIGDTIQAGNVVDANTSSTSTPRSTEFTIVGVTADSHNPGAFSAGGFVITQEGMAAVNSTASGISQGVGQIQLADGANQATVAADIQAMMPAGLQVYTPDAYVNESLATLTGGTDMLTMVLLIFVGIALIVCGLVIANTFAVLVSQRSRELALLRCLGAQKAQVYRSVLIEAFAIAVISSVIGVAAAIGLMATLVNIVGWGSAGGELAIFAVDTSAVIWPIVAGIVVTVIAAIGPARVATRVAPLQAMRPVDALENGVRGSRVRFVVGLIFTVVGGVILVFSSIVPAIVAPQGMGAVALIGFLGAFVGSAVSVVGVIMLAVFYVPATVKLVGKGIGRMFGVAGRLAALNSVRNPRRTAAAATALLIGVTLVATILTAGQVARETLNAQLGTEAPIDMTVQLTGSDGTSVAVTDAVLTQLRGVDGVKLAVPATQSVSTGTVTPAGGTTADSSHTAVQFMGIDPNDLALVSRSPAASKLRDGVALVGATYKDTAFTLAAEAGRQGVALTGVAGGNDGSLVITSTDYAKVTTVGTPNVAMLRLDDGLSSSSVQEVRDSITQLYPTAIIGGSALARSAYEQIIDTLLLIVTGLLAVAIVIALIGVSNTLSLSVIERTRENAMLRALGLTRGQLRGMLAIEAILMAGIAALLGSLLGVAYGALGAMSLFNAMGGVVISVPWLSLLAVVGAAALAGLIASIGPSRRAARLSPIEGLATT